MSSGLVAVEPPTLLILGCGYVGEIVARNALERGERVVALTRSDQSADRLRSLGIEPLVGHWLAADNWPSLPASLKRILVAVPHREDQGLGPQTHIVGLQNLFSAVKRDVADSTPKLVYLSSTGVYGDCDGQTVDEDTEPSPTRAGPQLAVAAERWLLSKLAAEKLTILRLAGIYGPGRVPLAQKLRDGEALSVPQHGMLNLVHVEDIAAVIDAVFERHLSRGLYVFSDGQPVARQDFYRQLARLCGVGEVRFAEQDATDSLPASQADQSRQRRATNKRVDPQRLVREIGFRYQYPSYREGLSQAIEVESD